MDLINNVNNNNNINVISTKGAFINWINKVNMRLKKIGLCQILQMHYELTETSVN